MPGVVDTAKTFLDALLSHDAESARLADDARRINNGVLAIEGAEKLREISG